ncbi:hypothetical protein ACFL6C_05005 [Myxococcota bacterium]
MQRSRVGRAGAGEPMEREQGLRWVGVVEATFGPMRPYFYGLDIVELAEIGKGLERRIHGADTPVAGTSGHGLALVARRGPGLLA